MAEVIARKEVALDDVVVREYDRKPRDPAVTAEMVQISGRIQAARARLRLTQRELAERLDEPRGTVSRWDCGLSVISSVDLVRVARALNTTVGYLCGEIGETEQADEAMLAQFRRLPPAGQAVVRSLMESLTDQAAQGKLGH